MRDQELETKLRPLTLQLDNWKKLHDFITYGLDKAKAIISVEQERQFTENSRPSLAGNGTCFQEAKHSGRALRQIDERVATRRLYSRCA